MAYVARTRLDEIVEEEFYKQGGPYTMEYGERIAERAFRHGVEQAMREWVAVKPGPAIQPAPAEEKRCSHCFVDCKCFHCRGDRRKGERRGHLRRGDGSDRRKS